MTIQVVNLKDNSSIVELHPIVPGPLRDRKWRIVAEIRDRNLTLVCENVQKFNFSLESVVDESESELGSHVLTFLSPIQVDCAM